MEKRAALISVATSLFAIKGFEATTTLEIAERAGVTEPVIYYYFNSKDGLFTHILTETFDEYFQRLDALDLTPDLPFAKIEGLIGLHFDFVDDYPEETYIIVSACPAKLRHTAHICAEYIEQHRQRLAEFISKCLEGGVNSCQFHPVPVDATAGYILASVNGLLRRQGLGLDQIDGLKEATVDFFRRSLLKNR